MRLKPEELVELNTLLRSGEINLPFFRKEVKDCGGNYSWLQKNIKKKNPNLPVRIMELLKLI